MTGDGRGEGYEDLPFGGTNQGAVLDWFIDTRSSRVQHAHRGRGRVYLIAQREMVRGITAGAMT